MMMNPMQLIQMIRVGGDPTQILTQMSRTNPMVGQVMRMTNGKTPNEMRNMAQEMARQRGVNLNQLAESMGLKLPK